MKLQTGYQWLAAYLKGVCWDLSCSFVKIVVSMICLRQFREWLKSLLTTPKRLKKPIGSYIRNNDRSIKLGKVKQTNKEIHFYQNYHLNNSTVYSFPSWWFFVVQAPDHLPFFVDFAEKKNLSLYVFAYNSWSFYTMVIKLHTLLSTLVERFMSIFEIFHSQVE